MGATLRPQRTTSLFWRAFSVNALLITGSVVLLIVTPLTISNPATTEQVEIVAAGALLLLVANVVLLRMSMRPLRELMQLMQGVDLLRPGQRLDVAGAREVRVFLNAFNQMLDRLERERQVSSSRTVGREEEERRRLASELHDQVGQGLTALLLQLKGAIAEAAPEARDQLLEAQAIARENLDEVRRIARRLRPTVLDDLGLPYALASLADAAVEQWGLAMQRDIDVNAPRLSEPQELALYRIAQEALTNAVRHSGAEWIELVLRQDDAGAVEVRVHDDGRGMLYAADVEGGGIRGMRERAVAVGAELEIASRPGGGTSVTAKVRP